MNSGIGARISSRSNQLSMFELTSVMKLDFSSIAVRRLYPQQFHGDIHRGVRARTMIDIVRIPSVDFVRIAVFCFQWHRRRRHDENRGTRRNSVDTRQLGSSFNY